MRIHYIPFSEQFQSDIVGQDYLDIIAPIIDKLAYIEGYILGDLDSGVYEATLELVEGIELSMPFMQDLALVIGEGEINIKILHANEPLTLLEGNDYESKQRFEAYLKFNLLKLRFPREWVKPTILDGDGDFITDPDTNKFVELEVPFGIQVNENFDFTPIWSDGNVIPLNLPPVMIGNTGLIFGFTNITFDFDRKTNIPEAEADGRPLEFVGFHAQEVIVGLPKFWKPKSGETAVIKGYNLLLGSPDGISGTIALEGGNLKTDLFGMEVELTHFGITFKKNEIIGSQIKGSLTIPGLKDKSTSQDAVIEVEGNFNDDGFSFSFKTPKDPYGNDNGLVLGLFNQADLILYNLTFGRRNADNTYYLSINAKLDMNIDFPIVGKLVPDEIGVVPLQINNKGNVEDFNLYLKWDNDGTPIEVVAQDGSVEALIPINKTIANILILNAIRVSIKPKGEGVGSKLKVLLNAGLKLGPVTGVVEGVGVQTDVAYNQSGGDIGPIDFSNFQFIPPTGIGIAINSEGIKGGGFISLDVEKGLYSGILDLNIKNKVSVTAIGLLATKLPNNQSGYSLLVLINATFPAIQLGFGFTLNGLGGVLGLHRAMNLQALQDGVRTNTINNILFPQNPVANANQIITDLQKVFPIQQDRFVFGFMGKLGWGSPSLITADIGLMIEIPSPVRVAILGVIKALLPDENKKLVRLQVNFVGTIDFSQEKITFDASLFDSRLLTYTISGDMAFRLIGGSNPNFLITVGGFHPQYTPPPLGLPSLRRITINLVSGDNPRVTLSSYMALTSNTAQFGASAAIFVKVVSNLTVEGYIGFDALFQFSPFYFIINASGSFAVKWKGKDKFSISISVKLQGPNPWSVAGSATIEVLKIKYTVNISKTWGNSENTTLPDIKVADKFFEALRDKTNWNIEQPEHKNQLVNFKEIDASETDLIAHPSSVIKVSQKVIPLKLNLEKFGNQKPSDTVKRFEISKVYIGAQEVAQSDLQEFFAPSQFRSLSNSQKISGKSFEKMASGVTFKGTEDLSLSKVVIKPVEYETIIVDKPDGVTRTKKKLDARTAELLEDFDLFLGGSSVTRSVLSSKFKPRNEKVKVNDEKYVIADMDSLTKQNTTSYTSKTEAQEAMNALINNDPWLAEKLQVIEEFELV